MAWNANKSTLPGSLYSVISIETTANKQGHALTTKTPKAKASVPDPNTLESVMTTTESSSVLVLLQ